jgi:hypothetical protein
LNEQAAVRETEEKRRKKKKNLRVNQFILYLQRAWQLYRHRKKKNYKLEIKTKFTVIRTLWLIDKI